MDIRRFLGGKAGTSALQTSDANKIDKNKTPTRKSTLQAREEVSPKENKLSGLDLLNSSGDSDSPLPKRVKEHMREKIRQKEATKEIERRRANPPSPVEIVNVLPSTGTKRRVIISSDEDEPPVMSKKPPAKRRKERTPSPEPIEDVQMSESDNEEDREFQKPAKRGRRNRTPPGQTKLNFAALGAKEGAKATLETKRKEKNVNLSKVNVNDYFANFGGPSSSKDVLKNVSKKTKSKDKPEEDDDDDVTVISPNKSKQSVDEPKTSKSKADKEELKKPSKSSPKKASKPEKVVAEAPIEEPKKNSPKKMPRAGEPEPRRTSPKKASKSEKKAELPVPEPKKKTEKKDIELPKRLEKPPVDRNSLLWVDKYKPNSLKQLVGQNGEKSPMNKLLGWLRDWPKYHMGEAANVKRSKPAPWMAQSDGTSFKAALLSGPPGIGKTTCAAMACKELGIELVETNASDARSKKCLEAVLGDLTGSHQINRMFGEDRKPVEKDKLTHVLIMDEVDGMSGNEDRAGIAELIQLIKTSRVPIICICNDRQSPKMRSLVNHCFDLRFQRPRVEAIRARVMTIVHQEGMKGITKEQIDELIEASNHDVRQTIYNLQMFKCGDNSSDVQKKDVNINTFEAARRIMSNETNLKEKQELFFNDYGILPLFVYENYLNIGSSTQKLTKKQQLERMRDASRSIAMGDVAEKSIRSTGAWSLLPTQAMLSCAIPSLHMNGHLRSMINFPSWLGKFSNYNKRKRLLQQLGAHTYLQMSSETSTLACDYIEPLHKAITTPLLQREGDGVREVIDFYNHYALTKEDAESINELTTWPNTSAEKIQTKVKSALTRALNKEHRLLPYAQEEITKGRKKAGTTAEAVMTIDEEGNEVETDGADGEASDDEGNSGDEVTVVKPKPAATTSMRGRGAGGARGGRGGRGRGSK